jgi:hypothetical protein
MKTPLSRITLLVTGFVFCATTWISAHHSFSAEFDAKKPITLKGTIVQMQWVNPHSWLHIDVKGPDGKVERWKLEFALPNALYRRGWRQKDLPVGASVVVDGYRAKDGTNTANAATVTLADGRRLFAGSSGTGAPNENR